MGRRSPGMAACCRLWAATPPSSAQGRRATDQCVRRTRGSRKKACSAAPGHGTTWLQAHPSAPTALREPARLAAAHRACGVMAWGAGIVNLGASQNPSGGLHVESYPNYDSETNPATFSNIHRTWFWHKQIASPGFRLPAERLGTNPAAIRRADNGTAGQRCLAPAGKNTDATCKAARSGLRTTAKEHRLVPNCNGYTRQGTRAALMTTGAGMNTSFAKLTLELRSAEKAGPVARCTTHLAHMRNL